MSANEMSTLSAYANKYIKSGLRNQYGARKPFMSVTRILKREGSQMCQCLRFPGVTSFNGRGFHLLSRPSSARFLQIP